VGVIENNTTVPLLIRLAYSLLLLCGMSLHGQAVNPFDEAAQKREMALERVEKLKRHAAAKVEAKSRATTQELYDKAANERAAAEQRAFDRGQKTALPAQEERESIGRMGSAVNAKRAVDGSVVKQGAPAAAAYNRVMETRRYFQHYGDPFLWNVNDSFTDKNEERVKFEQEAMRIYPELANSQSAFALRQSEIDRWLDSRQPPLARDARRKLLVAHMVSLELHHYLRGDRFGIGQVPRLHRLGQRPPAFIKRNNFVVEVSGADVLLPDGLRGKVIRGKGGQPDTLEWLDAEGRHQVWVPQEESGQVELFKNYTCNYRRLELQGGNFRLIFSKF